MATDSWVIRGTLDMLILKLLSIEPTHGWGLAERIQRLSGDTLRAQQGSLYASLHRLTREGWVRSWWEDTENGRRARFYDLTKAGARQLEIESDQWRRLATGVARIMAVTA